MFYFHVHFVSFHYIFFNKIFHLVLRDMTQTPLTQKINSWDDYVQVWENTSASVHWCVCYLKSLWCLRNLASWEMPCSLLGKKSCQLWMWSLQAAILIGLASDSHGCNKPHQCLEESDCILVGFKILLTSNIIYYRSWVCALYFISVYPIRFVPLLLHCFLSMFFWG